ncbi:MAG: DegV family protein [Ruminococcaceae bacterium]|nr:DegV family protein [Oscillospiraceae bacterium]
MSKQVIICSDSTSDLSSALIEKYGIKIIPLAVTLGGRSYTDGVDIDPDMIYAHYAANKELPKTAAPNYAAFCAFFEEQTQNGAAVVCFTISQTMSSTYNNARLAAANYPDVYVVDTKNLSTGGGLLVLAAAEMAQNGLAAGEIAKSVSAMTERVDASFVVDDLEFLHKGGRCSAVAALAAGVLQLKPCISVRDGKMGVGKKYRGKFARVLQSYIADRIGDGTDIDTTRVFVTHAGCDESIVAQCVAQVSEALPWGEVHVTRAGCTVSAHCGRNTLGVLFMHKS